MPDPVQEQELFKWSAPERPYKPVSNQFFTTAIAIVVLISIVLALSGEWMLITVLTSFVFAYYVWSMIPPDEIEYSLTSKGIRISGVLYAWNLLTRFWYENKWEYKLLVIDSPTSAPKRLYLVLSNQDFDAIGDIMAKYLLFEKPEATAVDRMSSWLMNKFPLEVS